MTNSNTKCNTKCNTKLIVGTMEYCYEYEYANDMSQWEGFKKAWGIQEALIEVWRDKTMARVNLISTIEDIVNGQHCNLPDDEKLQEIAFVLENR